MATINRVVLVGNLTRDPELRSTAGGHERVPAARRVQHAAGATGTPASIDERPNYFDVTVFGASGEACARFLAQGPAGRGRRAPGMARVGERRGRAPPGGRDPRRQRAVPRGSRRAARTTATAPRPSEEEEAVAF